MQTTLKKGNYRVNYFSPKQLSESEDITVIFAMNNRLYAFRSETYEHGEKWQYIVTYDTRGYGNPFYDWDSYVYDADEFIKHLPVNEWEEDFLVFLPPTDKEIGKE